MEELKERLRAQSDVALYGYPFEEDYRCATATALEQQSKHEKKLRYDILEQRPNERVRLRESFGKNAIAIEFQNVRVRRKEEEERLRNEMQDGAGAEKLRKATRENQKEVERLKQKEQRKAARKAEKAARKDEARKEKEARKAAKKEKKKGVSR